MHDDPTESSSPSMQKRPPVEGRPAAPVGPLRWVIRYTRGLILNQHLRRVVMFYAIIGAMLMIFMGGVFLEGWLRQNAWRFLIYYLVCGWLTITAALLAVYDLLLLRFQHRYIRRRMRSDLLGDEHKDEK